MKDFLEMEDEVHENGLVHEPLAGGREALQISGKVVSTETEALEKTPANLDFSTAEGNSADRKDLGESGDQVSAEKYSVNIPASSAPSSTSQQNITFVPISAVDKFVPPRDPKLSLPSFGLSSYNVDKVPAVTLASASATCESPGVSSAAWPDPRQENSKRLVSTDVITN